MSTSFPGSLDNFINPNGTDHLDNVTVKHSEQHINLNDATEALEAKVGIDLSNTKNTLDYITNLLMLTEIQHYSGSYAEHETISGKIFPLRITWYTSSSKTIKLLDREYAYSGSLPVPSTITMRLYDGTVSNTVIRTITDTVTYNKIFEISRTRTVV